MEKRISTRELAAVKYTAKIVAPIVAKKNKAKAMIDKWTKEYNTQKTALEGYESGLIAQLGLRTEQVVTRVIEPTGKFDKNGKEVKQTKYVLTDNVRYDSEKNEYIVTIKDEGDKEVAPADTAVVEEDLTGTDEPEVVNPEPVPEPDVAEPDVEETPEPEPDDTTEEQPEEEFEEKFMF